MGGSLRGRDFRLLVTASALSSMGDELALIALTLKVANLGNSGWEVAALLLAGLLPVVIFAPVAGVIVDNFETTRTLAIATAIQAVLAVALAFVTGFPTILLLAFLLGTGTAVATPALYTLVPAVVGDDQATPANAYLETARYTGMILGPLLAGTIYAARHSATPALLVDAATFVVISLAALALTTRRHPHGSLAHGSSAQGSLAQGQGPLGMPAEGAQEEARDGLDVIRQDRLLLATFSILAVVILFAAMDNVAEVFFARDTLHADGWGYGLLASMWIVGIVIGASQIGRRLAPERLVPALILASILGGVAIAVAAVFPMLGLAVAMFVVGGVANGVQSVSARSLIVHRVGDRYRGRVFAAYGGIANGMQIGAMVIAGGLVVALGARATLLVGGVGCVVAGGVGLLWYRVLPASVRAMPETSPQRLDGGSGETIVDIAEPGDHMVRLPETESAADSNSHI